MTWNPDPILLVNLVLCVIIVAVSIWAARRIRSGTPLYIGAAFALFGISHLATLVGLKDVLEIFLIVCRTAAYVLVIVGLFLVAREVLARMRAERAVQESEARFRSVVENIQDGFFRTDPEGNLLLWSPSLAAMCGAGASSGLKGSHIGRLFWSRPEEWEAFRTLLRTKGSLYDYEIHPPVPGGPSRIWSANCRAVLDPRGNLAGFEGVLRDITARRRAEDSLFYCLSMWQALSSVLGRFVDLPRAKRREELVSALADIGRLSDLDRLGLTLRQEGSAISREWTAEGVSPCQEALAAAALFPGSWAAERLEKGGTIALEHLEELPPAANREKAAWAALGVGSLHVVPLRSLSSLIGCLCAGTTQAGKRWTDEEANFFRMAASSLAMLLFQGGGPERPSFRPGREEDSR